MVYWLDRRYDEARQPQRGGYRARRSGAAVRSAAVRVLRQGDDAATTPRSTDGWNRCKEDEQTHGSDASGDARWGRTWPW